jgi:hypothetical protein
VSDKREMMFISFHIFIGGEWNQCGGEVYLFLTFRKHWHRFLILLDDRHPVTPVRSQANIVGTNTRDGWFIDRSNITHFFHNVGWQKTRGQACRNVALTPQPIGKKNHPRLMRNRHHSRFLGTTVDSHPSTRPENVASSSSIVRGRALQSNNGRRHRIRF